MKSQLSKVFLLYLSIFCLVKSAEITEEEGVLVLDDSNFDEAIKKHENILVEFYAPWCGHCKELAPHYAKAAQTLRKDETPQYLAKVDATINTELAKKYEIEGFPTLKWFSKGENEEYNGGRTEEEIVQWVRRKTGPVSRVLASAEDVTKFADDNEVAVVFFGNKEDQYSLFTELAKAYDDLQFGECKTEQCLEHFKVSNGNIVIFKKFDDKRVDLTTNYTAEELKKFVDHNSTKLVADFDEKTAQLVFGKQVPGIFFYRTKGSEHDVRLNEIATSIAPELKGKIQVVACDITGELEQRLAEYVGITAADLPTIRIHDTREDLKKYNFEGEFTKENVLAFVKDWQDGKLVAKLKSEDLSVTTNATGPVVALVGKNFQEIVNDNSKDVLVEFYAPWCGHCQKLAPIYEELATKLKDTNPNVIIAKIDATANDIEGADVQGFPTIKLYRRDQKTEPLDFDGERDLSGFVDFLQKQVKDFVRPEGIAASTQKSEEAEEENQDGQADEEAKQAKSDL